MQTKVSSQRSRGFGDEPEGEAIVPSLRISTNSLRLCGENHVMMENPIETTGAVAEDQPSVRLPVLTSANDIREAMLHLKRRPEGMTVVKAMSFELRRLFDPRKIEAYEFWGLVERAGDRISLSPRGDDLVRSLEAECRIYHRLLRETSLYQAAAEWVYQRRFDVVTHLEIVDYWRSLTRTPATTHEDNSIEDSVLCFFQLCQAADLGTMTMGRKGHPTRLRTDLQALKTFLEREPTGASERSTTIAAQPLESEFRFQGTGKIFISHREAGDLAEQVKTAIGLTDVECEIHERSENSELMPEPTMNSMRRCSAAVIIVTTHDSRGNRSLSEHVIAEICAAAALHNRKVVLLWQSSIPMPENLRGFLRFKIEKAELGWPVGVELVGVIKTFQLIR